MRLDLRRLDSPDDRRDACSLRLQRGNGLCGPGYVENERLAIRQRKADLLADVMRLVLSKSRLPFGSAEHDCRGDLACLFVGISDRMALTARCGTRRTCDEVKVRLAEDDASERRPFGQRSKVSLSAVCFSSASVPACGRSAWTATAERSAAWSRGEDAKLAQVALRRREQICMT